MYDLRLLQEAQNKIQGHGPALPRCVLIRKKTH